MSCIPLYSCKRVSVDLELALKLNLYYRYLKKKKEIAYVIHITAKVMAHMYFQENV